MILYSYAKINLGLKVSEKRPDGFHNLDMIMQSIDLCDYVHIEKTKEKKIIVSCDRLVCDEKSNLAYKAAKIMLDKVNSNFGVNIKIEKNIPIGAGLGGGSSNAASVIVGLDKALKLNLSKDEKIKIALDIGSDVPFCLFGGTLRCKGRGEVFFPVSKMPECKILIKEGKEKSFTSDAFKKLDLILDKEEKNDKIEILKECLITRNIKLISKNCFNDFEKIVETPKEWHLTGSGSAIFKIEEKSFTITDNDVIICQPKNCGVEIIEDNWD